MDTPNHTPVKQCSKCGVEYPATTEYFMLHKGALYSQCHECRRAAKRASHERNAEHNNARSAAWYEVHKEQEHVKRNAKNAENPEPSRQRAKAWRKANPEKRHAADKRYRERHPEAAKRHRDKFKQAHPERYSELKKARRKADPDKIRRADRATYAKNAEHYRKTGRVKANNRRAKVANAGGSFTQSDIDLQFKAQGGRCWYCGNPFKETVMRGDKPRIGYDVEHRVPIERGGTNDPANLVLACPSCNYSKGAKLPHEWGNRLL